MKTTALVFDFDGTLVDGGLDKGIHIMYAAWVTCFENGLAAHLHPRNLEIDLARLLQAYLLYPGAPRFLQLKALAGALLGQEQLDEARLSLEPGVLEAFPRLKEPYNRLYSALNVAAASRYWRPFPSCKGVLAALAKDYDLFIASGVPRKLLEEDLTRFDFDRGLFQGVFGSDQRGGSDKGTLLKKIKNSGYRELLFVGDSTKDLEYAGQAGIPFFRIRADDDFSRLQIALTAGLPGEGLPDAALPDAALPGEGLPDTGLPDESRPWTFTEDEIALYRRKVTLLLESYVSGKRLSPEEISRLVNS